MSLSAIEERNRAIVESYQAGANVADLRRLHGLSAPRIYQILGEAGVTVGSRKRGPKSILETDCLSHAHAGLGARIAHRRQFDRDITLSQCAHELGMSVIKLAQLEKGGYDPTLSELLRISDFVGQPLSEIFNFLNRSSHATY